MQKVLIVGGNRGIGLELCRQMSARGDRVFATTREPAAALEDLELDIIPGVDVGDDSSVARLAEALAGVKLDMLIHSAGILSRESWNDLDFNRIRHQFEVNTLGPLRVVSALRDNLGPGSKVGIVTSRVGSIDDNGSGGNYGYRMSKVAANMAGKNLSHDLGRRDIAVFLLHPGLVATEMTGRTGIDPADAARGLIERMDRLTGSDTGTFWHAEGYPLPW
ncbi:MAG: SDR family oxidoreductase [Gammaproteobacteria bacterium]|nr:SDR family oxidoreductase [Gammaproteobacteria bacterium]MYG67878.1 SDR family oxidoreductase [Gammaproteobacteria bacterium]